LRSYSQGVIHGGGNQVTNTHRKIGVGDRCAIWLRAGYKINRGKSVARDFNVSENTAWLWMSGKTPSVWHLEAMVAKWGRPFLEYIFQDISEPTGSIDQIINIRAELSKRDTDKSCPQASTENKPIDSGRFSVDFETVYISYCKNSMECISNKAVEFIDRAILVFEMQRVYKHLIARSGDPHWYHTLTIYVAASVRRVFSS
jgi:hypothetical protein